MRGLSVAVCSDCQSQLFESCRESLVRFTPELEEVFEVSRAAVLGSALEWAPSTFVAFLDQSIMVSPGWAGRLIRALEGSGAGAVGPLCNAASEVQRLQGAYQDIPEDLGFAERVAKDH